MLINYMLSIQDLICQALKQLAHDTTLKTQLILSTIFGKVKQTQLLQNNQVILSFVKHMVL